MTLSPRGFTTSVGAGPFRLTSGSRGLGLTARIPGTGISYYENLGGGQGGGYGTAPAPNPLKTLPPNVPQSLPVPSDREGEIASSGTSELTSEGLAEFKELLTKAFNERKTLLPDLRSAAVQATRLQKKHSRWSNGWLFRRIFPTGFVRLGIEATEAKERHEELQEQERLSKLDTTIELPEAARIAFSRLSDSFVTMAQSHRIWDTLSRVATDRVRERTTAHHRVGRKPVKFDLGKCDLIRADWQVPHLANANGGDLYLYPGFVVFYVSGAAFAVVDSTDVKITFTPASFIEEEAVPSDTQVISQTWKKANKDGSRDRRYSDNSQIPVVAYGSLAVKSSTGLNEEYMLSNAGSVDLFAKRWGVFLNTVKSTA